MKRFFTLIALTILLSVAQFTFAAPVSLKHAQQKAQQFWKQIGSRENVHFVDVTPYNQYSGFYILNVDNGNGFAIVSADTRAVTILGYSTKGSFDVERMPEVVRLWLNNYEQAIAMLRQTANESEAQLPEQYAPNAKNALTVDALVATTWDQGQYYNSMCPTDNSLNDQYLAGHPYTGCTNTAMAQVMKYWGWPDHGSGSHSYSLAGSQWYNWHYGTLSADFENTYYDWDNMPNQLTASSTQEQINAVATLMYHCGVSTESSYNDDNEGGTGAYVTLVDLEDYGDYCAENALYTFFRYKNTVQGLCKSDYSESVWVNMLKEELTAGRPLIYQGYSGGGWDAYGHCFVLDGYDAQGKFHFNWGWSGDYDGYFAINALRPYSGCNFSSYQEGLFYLEPDRNDVGVSDVDDAHILVQSINGQISVSGAEGQSVQVYDLQGRLISQCISAQGRETLTVSTSGLYLVRVGKVVRKVFVD